MKIIKFEQPSCAPCKMVDAFLQHINQQVDEKIDIVTDEKGMDKAHLVGVRSTPTLILIDDSGNEIDRAVGMQHEKIKELFAKRG
ncbi:thioredoxin family protein [Brevibacillus laterosporus]|uniref:thioredoxin domain n=1 Tax=Brevibacillus phage Sundance TaxID=1691958 RepID=UPI0006BE1596|nr:thioredoxin family protein [Brevibacillus laterosporus]YP_009194174.1 thioredoxin domain [Brevibacillus phage Sundance]ALA47940.1 putative thioredoxin [Brevibacillus phage Sundance]MCR8994559.1 thioredoxin family protein [Brevibacillus laterosporus]